MGIESVMGADTLAADILDTLETGLDLVTGNAVGDLILDLARRVQGGGTDETEAGAGGCAGAGAGAAGSGGAATLGAVYAALADLVDETFEPALAAVNALGKNSTQGEVLQATAQLQTASAIAQAANSAKDSVAKSAEALARNQ